MSTQKNVIADEKWKSTNDPNIQAGLLNEDGEPVKYEITKPINAYDADLFGLEFAYQRDFGFIAPALKCIGFYGTYTFIRIVRPRTINSSIARWKKARTSR